MITFNDVLEKTFEALTRWDKRNCCHNITIVRDVFGRISILIDNTERLQEEETQDLESLLGNALSGYFAKRIYWKKMPSKRKREESRIEPIIEMIETTRKEWRKQDGITYYLSERPIAKKAWINVSLAQEAVWPYENTVEGKAPKVVTFYSFKGGMGRTTALAGVALTLVKKGANVMMVDTDIEAPGLASLFLDEEWVVNGVLDYLIEHPITPERDVREYIVDITEPALLEEQDGKLYLLPAGKVDENYLQKLARIDYQDNRENYLRDSLCGMLEDIREYYDIDYILIDARAGFHDMGGVAASQLPHGTVLFGNNSRQSWEGLTQVIRAIGESHSDDFPILLVDSMCDKPTSSGYSGVKEQFTKKAHTVCIENYYDSETPAPGLDAKGVAHAPEFVPFDDQLLQDFYLYSSGSQDQDMIVKAYAKLLTENSYKELTSRIEEWFGEA